MVRVGNGSSKGAPLVEKTPAGAREAVLAWAASGGGGGAAVGEGAGVAGADAGAAAGSEPGAAAGPDAEPDAGAVADRATVGTGGGEDDGATDGMGGGADRGAADAGGALDGRMKRMVGSRGASSVSPASGFLGLAASAGACSLGCGPAD